ncbi:glycosyltransferase family 2 protein [Providencia stuartii]|uniref:Glycosyltransferase 2-like domain-containing protein n=1 Tax=Providencia stuartii TaxID=588 RepID=A0A1S1HPT9_PROST|nr:glycosyltransferase family 2 protein [Providencia stuartii]OHT23313.1 hypothetical protein A3Q29_07840 [Providencia stuartii]
MKNNVLLSVIIPCFNNEEYVYPCLSSLPLVQHELLEVIIINDGSTDQSLTEIQRYISEHDSTNIHIINQPNQGVSIARNEGLKYSNGKYITFLDADDLWSPSLWEKLFPILSDKSPDMVIYNALKFYNNDLNDSHQLKMTKLADGLHTINSICDLSDLFGENKWFAWCRVYKKELLDTILFPKNREYEDLAIVPIITAKVKRLFVINTPLIFYRVRENSITSKPKEKHIDDIIYAMSCIYDAYLNSNQSHNFKQVLAPTMQHEYSLLRSISRKVHGYCYFTKKQQQSLKTILKPFQTEFKFSFKMKAKFLGVYCLLGKIRTKKVYKHS